MQISPVEKYTDQLIIGLTGIMVEGGESPSQPLILTQVQNTYGGYQHLVSITTAPATAIDIQLGYVRENYKRDLSWLHDLPEFKQVKREPIAIVGGGPSLKDHLDELKGFKNIVAAGSCHDYLIKNGIIPTYATACDPDPIMANYYNDPNSTTKYLIATCCHGDTFDKLKNQQVYRWNCYSDAAKDAFNEIDPNFQAVGGGCTIGLRSMSLALILGYSDLHFFGFDSCLKTLEEHHAYGYTDEARELPGMGPIYSLKMGLNGPGDKSYIVYGYMIGQIDQFLEFFREHGEYFTPTFHCEGALPDYWRLMTNDKR